MIVNQNDIFFIRSQQTLQGITKTEDVKQYATHIQACMHVCTHTGKLYSDVPRICDII